MAKIKIRYAGVASANANFRRAIREIEQVEAALVEVQRDLPSEVQNQSEIFLQLKSCRTAMEAIRTQSQELLRVADGGLRLYQEADGRLSRSVPDNKL